MNNFCPNYSRIPEHVGIIPDGGGRYAQSNNISLYESYIISIGKLYEFLEYLYDIGVKKVSVYFSSKQNFRRTQNEIDDFEAAELVFLKEYIPKLVGRYSDLRVNFLGNVQMLSDNFQIEMARILRNATYNTVDSLNLNLCVAYDPFDELKSIAENYSPKKNIKDLMWCSHPLDLIIRSGGDNVLSNFMLLQSGFARIHTEQKMFNELIIEDIVEIINSFNGEERKYGE